MKQNKKIISAAVLGLLSIGVAPLAHAADGKGVECAGINACKGTGECGGKGHACAGKNACKGQGWVTKASKEECEKAGGHVEGAAKDAHKTKK